MYSQYLRNLLEFRGMNFAGEVANLAAGTGEGAPAGGGSGSGGAPAGGQPGGAQPGQQGGDGGGIAQLRSAYEQIKQKFEPFEKLNLKPEQITQYSTVYQKSFEAAAELGRQLGYPDAEIVEALLENPVETVNFLRNELQQRRDGQQQQQQDPNLDLNELVEQRLQQALAPINERENLRMTNEANSVFERTTYQMAADMYKAEGLDIANVPPDEVSMLMSAASEIMKYDEDALRALKYEGKTASIQRAFTEAKTMLDKYFVARSGRSGGARPAAAPGRAPNGQFQPGMVNGKKATLDDIFNNPEIVNPRYAEGR